MTAAQRTPYMLASGGSTRIACQNGKDVDWRFVLDACNSYNSSLSHPAKMLRTLLAEVERLNTHAERLSRINREVLAESELLSATVADQAAALAERDKLLRYCRNYVLGRLRNLERDPTTTRDSLSDVQSDLDAIDAALAASVSSASISSGEKEGT